jgi:hypothetical protein
MDFGESTFGSQAAIALDGIAHLDRMSAFGSGGGGLVLGGSTSAFVVRQPKNRHSANGAKIQKSCLSLINSKPSPLTECTVVSSGFFPGKRASCQCRPYPPISEIGGARAPTCARGHYLCKLGAKAPSRSFACIACRNWRASGDLADYRRRAPYQFRWRDDLVDQSDAIGVKCIER